MSDASFNGKILGVVGTAEARLIQRVDAEAGPRKILDVLCPDDLSARPRGLTMEKDERRPRSPPNVVGIQSIDGGVLAGQHGAHRRDPACHRAAATTLTAPRGTPHP